MHPSRRSLPFPLNCQLVRVGTADYGGVLDQVSQSRREKLASPRVVFVLVMKAGALWALWLARGFTRAAHVHLLSCPLRSLVQSGPGTWAGRARGLLPRTAKELLQSALAELWLSTCSSHPGWADICLWTLGSKGF